MQAIDLHSDKVELGLPVGYRPCACLDGDPVKDR
ncbi:hypothetical protein CLV68_3041 [Actinokineospora cianjurensis]|uniref:Uncharacterized protein n=1 Tax=Actinokineospora cianjurensis TaxID=585224 RepID=A0A421B2F7_9PSEU|nr:hypothetical protein CLV68_3041 [Actinokineospora cianjurensis]